MELAISVAALIVAVAAAAAAFWQGNLAKQQLDLARSTNGETEKALGKIRELTKENKRIATELKSDFDERIGKVFDNYVAREERRALAEHEDDRTSSEIAQDVMGWIGRTFGGAVEDAIKTVPEVASSEEVSQPE